MKDIRYDHYNSWGTLRFRSGDFDVRLTLSNDEREKMIKELQDKKHPNDR